MNIFLRTLFLCVLAVTAWAATGDPTITVIPNRTIQRNANTGEIQFSITGAVGATLVLSRESSNETIAPLAAIIFGGSGADRTVKVTPAAGQHGTVNITIRVNDGPRFASTSFELTVNAPPSIFTIADQVTNVSTAKSIQVDLDDDDDSENDLILTARSGNSALVAETGFTIPTSGDPRSLVITPILGATGIIAITLTVVDGREGRSERSFNLTINALPTLSVIPNQITDVNVPIAIPFTIADAEGIAALTLSATSDREDIIPTPGQAAFSGTGGNRTLTLTPSVDASGTVNVTLQVRDGNNATASRTFSVLVNRRPTISDIGTQTVDEDAAAFVVPVNVSDDGNLSLVTVTANSSDQSIISNAGLNFPAGIGSSRTLTITLVPNAAGTATITLSATDGRIIGIKTFNVVVRPVPDISGFSTSRNYFLDSGFIPLVQWSVVADRVTLASADAVPDVVNDRAKIKVRISNGLEEDELSVRTNVAAGIVLRDSNRIFTSGLSGVLIGTWNRAVTGRDELEISLASTATPASITAAIGAICYQNRYGSASTSRVDRTAQLHFVAGNGKISNILSPKVIAIKNPNVPPTYILGTLEDRYSVAPNSSKPITTQNLRGEDDQAAGAALRFTIINAPQAGFLRLTTGAGTQDLGVNEFFTQLDLENGKVSYLHSGSSVTLDAAQLQLDDGELASNIFIFPIRIGEDRTAAFISDAVTAMRSGAIEVLVSKPLTGNAEVCFSIEGGTAIKLQKGSVNQRGQQSWTLTPSFPAGLQFYRADFFIGDSAQNEIVGFDHLHMVIVVPPQITVPVGGG